MSSFYFKQEDFLKLAQMTPDSVLAAYQDGSNIAVLALEILGTPLTTLLAISPKGKYFSQNWWLGQSYLNWTLTAGFDQALVKDITASFKKSRISIGRIPINLLTLKGGVDEARGCGGLNIWDNNSFLTATIPTEAAESASKALEASYPLVGDYLLPMYGDICPSNLLSRYGEVQIERAFSLELPSATYHGTGYRNPLVKILKKLGTEIAVPAKKSQEDFLKETINELEGVLLKLACDRSNIIQGAHRVQYFYMYDAKEFEFDLMPLVARVNMLRSQALKLLAFPHFYESVAIRMLDVSLNCAQDKYQYLASDRDWMLRLHKLSPQSFSTDFEELENVDEYIFGLNKRYPCLVDDPLRDVLPKCPTKEFKL